jgi:hypothetical protein
LNNEDAAESSQTSSSERRVFLWNVIASVVASVVVIAFVQPFLSLVWDWLIGAGGAFIIRLVDMMYENASLGNRNWVVAVAASIFLFLPINLLVVRLYFKLVKRRYTQAEPKPRRLPEWLGAALALLFMVVSATVPSAYIFTDLQLNASFDQRLTVLAPHISDQQVKELRAQWALMKSRDHHRSIQGQMQAYADKAGIHLPEPLLAE